MLITDIDITDLSTSADARGHIILTTQTGQCHLDCQVAGLGPADAVTRYAALIDDALALLRRMPDTRRFADDILLAPGVRDAILAPHRIDPPGLSLAA